MSTQSANSPLWKVLNENRSNGNWEVRRNGEPWRVKEWAVVCNIQYGGGDTDLIILAPVNTATLLKMEAEANAQYTALAVNEFANVVEALEECMKYMTVHKIDSCLAWQKSKALIARIS